MVTNESAPNISNDTLFSYNSQRDNIPAIAFTPVNNDVAEVQQIVSILGAAITEWLPPKEGAEMTQVLNEFQPTVNNIIDLIWEEALPSAQKRSIAEKETMIVGTTFKGTTAAVNKIVAAAKPGATQQDAQIVNTVFAASELLVAGILAATRPSRRY